MNKITKFELNKENGCFDIVYTLNGTTYVGRLFSEDIHGILTNKLKKHE